MKYVCVFAIVLVMLGLCSAASFKGRSLRSKLQGLQKAKRGGLFDRKFQGLQRRTHGNGNDNSSGNDDDTSSSDDDDEMGLAIEDLGKACHVIEHIQGWYIKNWREPDFAGADTTLYDACDMYFGFEYLFHQLDEEGQHEMITMAAYNDDRILCLLFDMVEGVLDIPDSERDDVHGFCQTEFGSHIEIVHHLEDMVYGGPVKRGKVSNISSLLDQIKKLAKK